MNGPEPPDFLIWKGAGSVVGALISLAYVKPLNLRDALARGASSVACGIIFGFVIHEYFGWPASPAHWVAASAAASLFSWTIIGVGIKILQSTTSIPKK